MQELGFNMLDVRTRETLGRLVKLDAQGDLLHALVDDELPVEQWPDALKSRAEFVMKGMEKIKHKRWI